jgi:hypothetical protein
MATDDLTRHQAAWIGFTAFLKWTIVMLVIVLGVLGAWLLPH